MVLIEQPPARNSSVEAEVIGQPQLVLTAVQTYEAAVSVFHSSPRSGEVLVLRRDAHVGKARPRMDSVECSCGGAAQ